MSRDPLSSTWADRLAELRALAALQDDWDGEGSPAPGAERVEATVALLAELEALGCRAPERVCAGVNGSILVEWQRRPRYLEAEVHGPGRADLYWLIETNTPEDPLP